MKKTAVVVFLGLLLSLTLAACGTMDQPAP